VYESAWSPALGKEDYLAAMGKIDLKGAFPNGSLNARNFRVQWVGNRRHRGGGRLPPSAASHLLAFFAPWLIEKIF
jgi:hypothetical protein